MAERGASRIVVALGGNALLKHGEAPTAQVQRANVRAAAAALAGLAAGRAMVLTHGNGPQVGLLALQSESYAGLPAYPLDVLDAESEGLLGYLIEQELGNALPGREVATLLTRVEVAADDPAFADPSKPIGPIYDRERADLLARERGWTMAPKVEAACDFVERTGAPAAIGALEDASRVLAGEAGTAIRAAGALELYDGL